MARKVTLGAPSLTGKDANTLVTEIFGDATFPLTVIVVSLMPMPTVFPEIGVHLLSVAAQTGASQEVVINNMDAFQRFASSLEQVAELNGFETALTVEEVEAEAEDTSTKTLTKAEKKAAAAAAAAAASTDTAADTSTTTDAAA